MNLAIRKAIELCPKFSDILTLLSKWIRDVKKNIALARIHRSKNSIIKRQQLTRWSSSFIMLASILKAFKNKVFSNDHSCPVPIDKIKEYFLILAPCYIFTNDMQFKDSNISLVVPSIITIIYDNLDRMILNDQDQSKFRDTFISALLKRFEFELNSKVYLVAAVLNVANLTDWKDRSFGTKYYENGKT